MLIPRQVPHLWHTMTKLILEKHHQVWKHVDCRVGLKAYSFVLWKTAVLCFLSSWRLDLCYSTRTWLKLSHHLLTLHRYQGPLWRCDNIDWCCLRTLNTLLKYIHPYQKQKYWIGQVREYCLEELRGLLEDSRTVFHPLLGTDICHLIHDELQLVNSKS